jgi:DinB superfamily
MKVTHHLSRLEPMVLHPLRGLPEDHWHRAPEDKWTIAQILEHLAVSVDVVATLFAEIEDTGPMQRRSKPHQAVLRHLMLGAGEIPGGLKSPVEMEPSNHPDPELMAAEFRMGVEMTRGLVEKWPEERQQSVFVTHPRLGDLNLPEWVRFHYLHCRQHGEEIKKRMEWIGNSAA